MGPWRAGQRRRRWAVTFTLRRPLRPPPPALTPSLLRDTATTTDILLQMALLGLTFHCWQQLSTCGTACPLPDTSTGPSSPACFWQEQPLAMALDLDPFSPAGSECRKESRSRSANIRNNSSAISTPATSSSCCESGLEGYLVLINPHLFTVKHSASGAQRSTELVCILEGHKELSHLTSHTSQPINFHSVALYLSLITPTLRLMSSVDYAYLKRGIIRVFETKQSLLLGDLSPRLSIPTAKNTSSVELSLLLFTSQGCTP